MWEIRSNDRIKVADFGREQTKQANQGTRRYKKEKEENGE